MDQLVRSILTSPLLSAGMPMLWSTDFQQYLYRYNMTMTSDYHSGGLQYFVSFIVLFSHSPSVSFFINCCKLMFQADATYANLVDKKATQKIAEQINYRKILGQKIVLFKTSNRNSIFWRDMNQFIFRGLNIFTNIVDDNILQGVFAKNERGYRLTAKNNEISTYTNASKNYR